MNPTLRICAATSTMDGRSSKKARRNTSKRAGDVRRVVIVTNQAIKRHVVRDPRDRLNRCQHCLECVATQDKDSLAHLQISCLSWTEARHEEHLTWNDEIVVLQKKNTKTSVNNCRDVERRTNFSICVTAQIHDRGVQNPCPESVIANSQQTTQHTSHRRTRCAQSSLLSRWRGGPSQRSRGLQASPALQ